MKTLLQESWELAGHGWLGWMLLLVPVAVLVERMHQPAAVVFGVAALAVVPLAGLLGRATEEAAARMGPTAGGLLNGTLGNAGELIIALLALRRLADDGTTVFVSSHLLVEVEQMCDRVGVLAHGKLLAEGPPGTLRGFADQARIEVDDLARAVAVITSIDGVELMEDGSRAGAGVVRVSSGRLDVRGLVRRRRLRQTERHIFRLGKEPLLEK